MSAVFSELNLKKYLTETEPSVISGESFPIYLSNLNFCVQNYVTSELNVTIQI